MKKKTKYDTYDQPSFSKSAQEFASIRLFDTYWVLRSTLFNHRSLFQSINGRKSCLGNASTGTAMWEHITLAFGTSGFIMDSTLKGILCAFFLKLTAQIF